MESIGLAVFLALISFGSGVSLRKQIEHVRKIKKESLSFTEADLASNEKEVVSNAIGYKDMISPLSNRRFFPNSGYSSVILGGPSLPNHLPAAEPILPGHTLLRPSLNMLKSAVKFPHRDMDNGAGVYGNIDNLGIKFDGLNDRVLYSGFRRMPSDYIMIVPVKSKSDSVPKAIVSPIVLDLYETAESNGLQRDFINDATKRGRSIYTDKLKYLDRRIKNNKVNRPKRLKRFALRGGGDSDVSSTTPGNNNDTTTPNPCPTKPNKMKKFKVFLNKTKVALGDIANAFIQLIG